MRRLTGSDAGGLTAPSSSDISLFTDVFALLSAVLGVVFATMGCVQCTAVHPAVYFFGCYFALFIEKDSPLYKGGRRPPLARCHVTTPLRAVYP
jgi:hypothetical protein